MILDIRMVEVLPEFRSEKRFALSLSQRNIWDQERALPGTSVNNISTTIRINGRVDFGLLQRALDRVLEADASLRTRITLQEGEPAASSPAASARVKNP